jgi:hypothetical protein
MLVILDLFGMLTSMGITLFLMSHASERLERSGEKGRGSGLSL